jgi:hypothetical protein
VARHKFGGALCDWTFDVGDAATSTGGLDGNLAVVIPSAEVTFWDAATGGTQITDLTDLTGTPITSVTSDSVGQIPEFWGPDGPLRMYADGNGGLGPRRVITANDLDTLDARLEDAENTILNLQALADAAIVAVTYDEGTDSWPTRPAIAGTRIVHWYGPAASPPPTGYMVQNDQFFGWAA